MLVPDAGGVAWIDSRGKEVDHVKLGEVMTGDPIAVGPETPLKDVAAILLEQRISGVPVIGERLEVTVEIPALVTA